jgi:hypothetical protein
MMQVEVAFMFMAMWFMTGMRAGILFEKGKRI